MHDFDEMPPDTHMLSSLMTQHRGHYSAMVHELVDNGWDAGATEIDLQVRPTLIQAEDNGCGITRGRIDAAVRLGAHAAMSTTQLGRFGIGMKLHAISAGDELHIASTSSDGHVRREVNWAAMLRLGRWAYEKPVWGPVRGNTGTRITVKKLRWKPASINDVNKIRTSLAETFYPALAERRMIRLNDDPIPVLAEPALRDVIEATITLESGKGAHVRGGMLVHRDSLLYQVQVSYKHRVIMAKCAFGCGDHSGLHSMFARVTLIGPWELGQFKNEIVDSDADELEAELEQLLKPILEQCSSQSLSAKLDDIESRLNEMLPPEMKPSRPPKQGEKKKTDEKNKRKPKKKGKLYTSGVEAETGPTTTAKRKEVKITFEDNLVLEHGYGRCLDGKPFRIELAKDNPHVASLLHHRDEILATQSLYQIAMMLYCQHRTSTAPGLFDSPFGLAVWLQVARQKLDAEGEGYQGPEGQIP